MYKALLILAGFIEFNAGYLHQKVAYQALRSWGVKSLILPPEGNSLHQQQSPSQTFFSCQNRFHSTCTQRLRGYQLLHKSRVLQGGL